MSKEIPYSNIPYIAVEPRSYFVYTEITFTYNTSPLSKVT